MSLEAAIPSGTFRHDMRSTLDRIQHHGARIPISRHKEPAAVIVPVDWYERAAALPEKLLKLTVHWEAAGDGQDAQSECAAELRALLGEESSG